MWGLGFKPAWIKRINKTNKSKMPSGSWQTQEIRAGIKCAALCPVILKISRRFSCSGYECGIPSQRLSEAVLTIIACQDWNYMLQIPAGLNLARHILFRVCALTATVGRLRCLQILYQSPRRYKNIRVIWEEEYSRGTFVPVSSRHITKVCCFHHGIDVSHFYFQKAGAFWVQ